MLSNEFKSLPEFLDYFKDEEICKQYLEQQRWGGNPVCPFCGHTHVYRTARGYKCANKECYKKFSITVGTVFENSKIKLRTWFAAVYLITAHKKGISSLQLSRDLGIGQKAAWFMLHRIREMLRTKAPEMLEDMVEADETYIGGKSKNKHASKRTPNSQGRSVKDKTPVFGIIERQGKVHTRVVPNTQGKTLKPIIKEMVKEGTIVITDEWLGYAGLNKHFPHEVMNHQRAEYVRNTSHTNNIEGYWSHFKRMIYGIYHQVSPKHLNRYCDESTYRYNTREIKDLDRFEHSMTQVAGRLKYNDLIGKVNG